MYNTPCIYICDCGRCKERLTRRQTRVFTHGKHPGSTDAGVAFPRDPFVLFVDPLVTVRYGLESIFQIRLMVVIRFVNGCFVDLDFW
mgnify:CR=1 FL=1